MANVFRFDPAEVQSSISSGKLSIYVSTGAAAEEVGVANSKLSLVTQLRQAGLPAVFNGVIRLLCIGTVNPATLHPVANELRAAGWSKARFEAISYVSGGAYGGPAATAALRTVGARAATHGDSAFSTGATPGPHDQALYAHERVHQL
jgi:hypothetical protein